MVSGITVVSIGVHVNVWGSGGIAAPRQDKPREIRFAMFEVRHDLGSGVGLIARSLVADIDVIRQPAYDVKVRISERDNHLTSLLQRGHGTAHAKIFFGSVVGTIYASDPECEVLVRRHGRGDTELVGARKP